MTTSSLLTNPQVCPPLSAPSHPTSKINRFLAMGCKIGIACTRLAWTILFVLLAIYPAFLWDLIDTYYPNLDPAPKLAIGLVNAIFRVWEDLGSFIRWEECGDGRALINVLRNCLGGFLGGRRLRMRKLCCLWLRLRGRRMGL